MSFDYEYIKCYVSLTINTISVNITECGFTYSYEVHLCDSEKSSVMYSHRLLWQISKRCNKKHGNYFSNRIIKSCIFAYKQSGRIRQRSAAWRHRWKYWGLVCGLESDISVCRKFQSSCLPEKPSENYNGECQPK